MKKSKLLMLGTAVALTMSSFSLLAITTDELADAIRHTRACPAAGPITDQENPIIDQEPQGWFSSFRQATGNAFRTLGDSIRTEGDKSTAGQIKESLKDGIFSTASAKIGISLDSAKDVICNSVGNAFRTLGQWIKGGEATQTTTRVILDNLNMHKYSTDFQVKQALRTVASATIKADEKKALEDYELVIEGLIKRGYATKEQIKGIDIKGIYLEEMQLMTESN